MVNRLIDDPSDWPFKRKIQRAGSKDEIRKAVAASEEGDY